ncbi:MAG: phosphoribosylamine--glycine ligase [Acidimicrobiia bacterium]|nr:phosphoribosylamine--glycine ligase [Acidimicrobiia bacterium]
MKVLLLGGGGREHAIGWKLTQNPNVELVSSPGNPGLAALGAVISDVDITNPELITGVALGAGADLVVIGPEAPLAAGVVDRLVEAGIPTFGPIAAGAKLEASKAFAKDVMRKAGVPTADSWTFTALSDVVAHLEHADGPFVVKADGLAGGKGVLVTEDRIAAVGWARLCLEGHFGEAGNTVVIEEFLDGQEVSLFYVCDGTRAVPLIPSRDYKRLADGDKGPNTGGMGCFAPVDDLPEGLIEMVDQVVVEPTLDELRNRGIEFRGFLYCGMMLTAEGPRVLEFNCRLGDPETQAVLPLLDEDLAELLLAGARGRLTDEPFSWHPKHAVDVVLASSGYPEAPETGMRIDGIGDLGDDVLVFHAGTGVDEEGLVTTAGRVLNVVGLGSDLSTARDRAYAAAAAIEFEGKQFRTDIAEIEGER